MVFLSDFCYCYVIFWVNSCIFFFRCCFLAFDAFFLSLQVTVELSWVNIKPALLCMTFVLVCGCVCLYTTLPASVCNLLSLWLQTFSYHILTIFSFFAFFFNKNISIRFYYFDNIIVFAQDCFLKRFFMEKLLNCIQLQTQQMRTHTHSPTMKNSSWKQAMQIMVCMANHRPDPPFRICKIFSLLQCKM